MKVWGGEGDFRALLGADAEVSAALNATTLDGCFDDGHHTRRAALILERAIAEPTA